MSSDFYIARLVLVEQQGLCKVFTAPRSKIPRIDDSRLAELFAREVLGLLVGRELLSPEWAERILSWPHSGFNVHSLVRAKTKSEAERVGKYMLRPVLALEGLTFLEPEGQVGYRWGRDGPGQETEVMDYLEFIARVTSHIPDKAQVMVRYFGLYANAHRGKVKKASLGPSAFRIVEEELRRLPSKGWAAMIRKVYEVDPMICSKCGGRMKVVAFITEVALMASMRAADPCFYRGRPAGGRRERGILLSIW